MKPHDSRKTWQKPNVLRSISSEEMSQMMQELEVKGYFGFWTNLIKLTCTRSGGYSGGRCYYQPTPGPGTCGIRG